MASDYRIGHGFDAHRFGRGRKFVLGGVEIPYALGLVGHSDADVLLHALMNALLGAMGKGDIGGHFPDTDPQYKGISSRTLLKRVLRIMKQEKCRIINGDITLLAQKPRLAPFFDRIKGTLARLLQVKEAQLNIKAGTTEKLGWIGRGQGMAAIVVVLLARSNR
ncbi:MAG: 2-C-methyl-D-erythritol 2,4-cyclodiphosphate synthase [Candidatus Binatia bacterium]